VTYGKSSTLAAVGTTLTGGFGYIGPGPLIAGEIVGTGGVAASTSHTATFTHTHRNNANSAVLIDLSLVRVMIPLRRPD
jgi:hypothetical protein